MKIHQVLFFCFLSALQDGNTGLTNAVNLFAGAEGGSGSLHCTFTSSGNTKFFCKGECEAGNILIKTDDVTAQSGRYSIRYEDLSSGKRQVSVTIKQLTKSDSGRYRFGLGGSLVPDDSCDFDLIVIDEAPMGENTRFIRAGIEGGNVTYPCFYTVSGSRKFFCKGECNKEEDILVETEENRTQSGRYSIEYTKGSAVELYVTINQLRKSDSGRYQCGYGRPLSPDSSYSFDIFVTDGAPKTPSVSVRPSGEITEGSSVTLTCSSDANPAAKYTWYKKNVNPDLQPLSNGPQLVFSSIQSSDSGEYYCTAENQLGKRTSRYILIDVKSPTTENPNWISTPPPSAPPTSTPPTTAPPTSTLPTQSLSSTSEAPLVEGGSVTYPCTVPVNGRSKFLCKGECKGEDILIEAEEDRAQIGRYSIEYREGSGLYVTITHLEKSDTGRYKCGYGTALSPVSSFSFFVPAVRAPSSDLSHPGFLWPLLGCMSVIVVLVAVVLLFVYKLQLGTIFALIGRETSDRNQELSVRYEYRPPVSKNEDSAYQNLDPDYMDPDQTYSTIRETANK